MAKARRDHNQLAVELAENIRDGRLRAGSRLPANAELADQHGVSISTVGRALATLQAQGLIIRRQRLGTFVAAYREVPLRSIAFVADTPVGYPQAAYLQGVISTLPEDCKVFLEETSSGPGTEISRIEKLRGAVDGVIVYPWGDARSAEALAELNASGTPVVCVDRQAVGQNLDAFVSDNYGDSARLMKILRERGHRRIAHITDDEPAVSTVAERLRAYQDGIRDCGTNEQRWLRMLPARGWSFTRLKQTIHDTLFTLRAGSEPVTAVFCAHDGYLAPLLAACEELNLTVPDDLEIASYNDWPELPINRLDRVHRAVPPCFELGVAAAKRLIARHKGEDGLPMTTTISARILSTHLHSTGGVPPPIQ